MTNFNFDDLLLSAEKPSRYIGAEVNSAYKDSAEINFLLAFPDTYEVGMSHLGMQILYSILNEIPYVFAQRCFAPWPDREKQLRDHELPLTSLESQKPIKDFDIVGFSLQYELSYTNVLNMLELGGVPLRRNERRGNDPLIIAGGPCCFNPAPLTDFIDAFVIGEGEEVVGEITASVRQGKKENLSRTELIKRMAQIPGIYVPSHHDKKQIIKKRIVADINLWAHPLKPVVPLMQTVHDRIILEIARGCTRGCRFCQAGMLWRPYRERNVSLLEQMAEKLLAATGHDEISLLSLSSGDYSCLEPLLKTLMEKYYSRRVALALPSLRVESLNETLIEEIKRTRKTSFTLAPEAGTDKMRMIINKGNTAADLLTTVDKVFAAGWKSIKLYFMIGLPEETQTDLEGIIDLGYQALQAAKHRGQVTISLSTFVPKPHTPFQWHRQISLTETYAKQNFIRQRISGRNLGVKWHDAEMSMLEGLFSRGDEKMGVLLEAAFRKGCRFDGWTDLFRFDLWKEAMTEAEIDPENYLRERNNAETLPWDNIDCGVSREFLLTEKQKAITTQATADCRFDKCQNCGACDFSSTKNIFATKEELPKPAALMTSASTDSQIVEKPVSVGAVQKCLDARRAKTESRDVYKNTLSDEVCSTTQQISAFQQPQGPEKNYRITFTKIGRSRYLSHLELSSALLRALRRSSLSLSYSAGFHPHPKISFATATSVGMESAQEFVDITAREYRSDFEVLKKEINSALPQGIEVLEIRPLTTADAPLAKSLRGFVYELYLPVDMNAENIATVKEKINNFLATPSFSIQRLSKGKSIIKDIRPFVQSAILDATNKKITMNLIFAQNGSVRPTDIITHVLGFNPDYAGKFRTIKTKTVLS